MSIWNDIADLFKDKDKLIKEKEKEVEDARVKEKNIEKKLKILEKNYNDSLPKFKNKDYSDMFKDTSGNFKFDNTKTKDELSKLSNDIAYKNYDFDVDKIKDKYEEKINKSNQNKKNVQEDGVNYLKNIFRKKKENQEKIINNASKNGVADSSIAKMEILDNENSINKIVTSSINKEKNKLKEIDNLIENSKFEMDKALKELDIKVAQTYKNNLDKLLKEKQKKQADIKKYNSDLKKEKNKFEQNKQLKIKELQDKDLNNYKAKNKATEEYEKKHGYTGKKLENYSKRYDIALNFYNSLPKDVALKTLKSNPKIKHYLGNFYYTLLDYQKARLEKRPLYDLK